MTNHIGPFFGWKSPFSTREFQFKASGFMGHDEVLTIGLSSFSKEVAYGDLEAVSTAIEDVDLAIVAVHNKGEHNHEHGRALDPLPKFVIRWQTAGCQYRELKDFYDGMEMLYTGREFAQTGSAIELLAIAIDLIVEPIQGKVMIALLHRLNELKGDTNSRRMIFEIFSRREPRTLDEFMQAIRLA